MARRVALLFFACSMVPLAGLAVVTSFSVTSQLDLQAQDRLASDVKAVAMDALGRLDLFESRVRFMGGAFSSRAGGTGWSTEQVNSAFDRPPDTLVYFPDEGGSIALRGGTSLPALSPAQQDQLGLSGRTIADLPHADGRRHFLLVSITSGDHPGLIAASIDEARVFGLDDSLATMPPQSEMCVFGSDRMLACSPGAPADVFRTLESAGADGGQLVEGEGGRVLVHTRSVPLQTLYGAAPWTVVMVRPQAGIREPMRGFLRDTWVVALLTGLIVSWISLHQIRQQLRPLDALIAATQRMADRKFEEPVYLHSHDEFEDLGNAFNELAARLRTQFDELETFSLGTLAALARAIDAKSPWTGGHSERVTQLAVEIATEMGLPQPEISELSRGGLVHDIGKLATPPGILDKQGKLTPEEFAVMREHPKKGVHILEPIPAFGPLLPIVGQHHERWDGAGYPEGLAGEQIARTARVLAVADVWDALSSDRPYRKGMPVAEVVRHISAGAGSQFDARVVEAFVRVMARTPRGEAT